MRTNFLQKQNKRLLQKSISEIELIRKRSDLLAICGTPTGYSWLGVNIATSSLFPENTFHIPQYYSNSILNEEELKKISNAIIDLGFKQVIFSGFAPFYSILVSNIYLNLKVKIIYHGFLSELSENKIQQNAFNKIINFAQEGKISSIGFVKKGFALSVNHIYDIPTFEIILPNNNIASIASKTSNLEIGCLVNTSFRKNIHNQAMAALMVNNANLHVFNTSELNYLPKNRIISHTLMSHDDFITLLGSMTINLHVTFSEGMGGQVCSESIAQGVPCISAYTSSFFDYDDELRQKLIVDGFDDSWHIYKKIEEVLKERDYLSKKCIEYSKYLNKLAEEKLKEFLT